MQSAPYLEIDNDGKYQGYCVDLAEKICRGDYLNIDYKLELVPDGKYGELKDSKWNGMVGELAIRVRADNDVDLS